MFLRTIFNLLRRRDEPTSAFAHVMSMAEAIAAENPKGLQSLMRALLRPLQAEQMVAVAEREDHAAPAEIDAQTFFFDIFRAAQLADFWLRPTPQVQISLARDIVLPTPWRRHRFADALALIGEDRKLGSWKYDRQNQHVSVLRPWNIAFVTGGNHSITAGILLGEGELEANEVFDLTSLLDRVSCDGKQYVDTKTGAVIGQVYDYRRAAVFEIGRLMVKAGLGSSSGVVPDNEPVSLESAEGVS